jgi:hypothetical protein
MIMMMMIIASYDSITTHNQAGDPKRGDGQGTIYYHHTRFNGMWCTTLSRFVSHADHYNNWQRQRYNKKEEFEEKTIHPHYTHTKM